MIWDLLLPNWNTDVRIGFIPIGIGAAILGIRAIPVFGITMKPFEKYALYLIGIGLLWMIVVSRFQDAVAWIFSSTRIVASIVAALVFGGLFYAIQKTK